ncbi:MAG: 2-amino-4-hydroxy-6-hydroxymethyldihydropteridine diphosphokinase [Prevotella sp.]|nr:2-amino-4-hydroxy-6-hydroxymethyldihydropteridine diphosphokinase [Prevotella sp.]
MKVHEVIISLGSNENQEANLAKAREQLTQLMTEVHFTSAIWTEPIDRSPFAIDHSTLNIDHSRCNAKDGQQTSAAANNGQWSIVNGQSKKYLNQLCKGTTAFGEGLLCEVLKETEKRIGRIKNEDGIVVIDLDLLEYDGKRHHLRDWNRDFVKNLLNEL